MRGDTDGAGGTGGPRVAREPGRAASRAQSGDDSPGERMVGDGEPETPRRAPGAPRTIASPGAVAARGGGRQLQLVPADGPPTGGAAPRRPRRRSDGSMPDV